MIYLYPRIVAFPKCVHERCETDDVPYRPPPVVLLHPDDHPPVGHRVLVLGTARSEALRVGSTPNLLTKTSSRPPENGDVLKITCVTLSTSFVCPTTIGWDNYVIEIRVGCWLHHQQGS